jgi:phosphoribosyl 1,2-cyclic phosphodiesterase
MQIKFIGTGGAFDIHYTNSSAIVYLHGKKYLIDCGYSVFPKLIEHKLADDIDGVMITHLHDDHVGSLGTLAFYRFHVLGKKLKVLLPPKDEYVGKFKQLVSGTIGQYDSYLDFEILNQEDIISIDTTGKHYLCMESFAYVFKNNDQIFAYSGDLGDPDFLFEELNKLNLNKNTIVFHDICFHYNPTHSLYKDLMKWQKKFQVYGYHCNPEKNPADNTIPLIYNEKGFNF